MNPVKTILFPFVHSQPFFEGYAWSSELARRLGARFLVLSLSPSSLGTELSMREVYHQLLEATGHFLQNYPTQKIPKSVKHKVIKAWGPAVQALTENEELLSADMVVLDPAALPAGLPLQEIIRKSSSVVSLPRLKNLKLLPRFESLLEQAELYKIKNDFFEEALRVR